MSLGNIGWPTATRCLSPLGLNNLLATYAAMMSRRNTTTFLAKVERRTDGSSRTFEWRSRLPVPDCQCRITWLQLQQRVDLSLSTAEIKMTERCALHCRTWEQCDHIRHFFAKWVIVCFWQFHDNYRNNPHFWANLLENLVRAFILTRNILGYILG
jgi:hypothetical protein